MAYNNGIELRLLVNGRPMREYSHKGSTFYESRNGTNYTIKLKNDNSFKVMAVLSVDGLDVITGKAADSADKGYILDAYSAIEVKGYRISDENSAAFVFTSKGKSYVQSATGDARNSGVIGVRVFKEKQKTPAPTPVPQPTVIHHHHHHPAPTPLPYYVYPWNPYPLGTDIYYSKTGDSSPGVGGLGATFGGTTSATSYTVNASATYGSGQLAASYTCDNNVLRSRDVSKGASNVRRCSVGGQSVDNSFDAPISYKQFDTGTAWGKKLDDKVRREYFAKDCLLTEIVIYYASESALVDMGIDLNETPRMAEEDKLPKAFKSKYCQPPKGWVG